MDLREHKRVFILFYMVGFFFGIIYANTFFKDYTYSLGIFSDYFITQYSQTEINTGRYLFYLMRIRLLTMILIFGLGLTKVRTITVWVFLIWTGFLCGIILCSATMRLGIWGIIYVCLSLFPHMICYVFAYYILVCNIYAYPTAKWDGAKIFIIIAVMLMGIIMECRLNPMLIKMFLKTV